MKNWYRKAPDMVSDNDTHAQIAYVFDPSKSELIAAAPDMLEALLAAHEFMADRCCSCDHFSGRPDINGCTLEGGGCSAILKVENALRKAIGWRSAYEAQKEKGGVE